MITTTNTILLDGLTDPSNDSIWNEFDGRYRPVIEAFARKLGLSSEDAADAAQETMLQFVRDFRRGKYDRDRGRLRSWIFGIARNRVLDQQRAGGRRREWRGQSAIGDLAADDAMTKLWEQQWRNAMLREALRELRAAGRLDARTIRAFELIVFERKNATEAAAEVAMSVDEVYVAKSRVLGRLQKIVSEMESVW